MSSFKLLKDIFRYHLLSKLIDNISVLPFLVLWVGVCHTHNGMLLQPTGQSCIVFLGLCVLTMTTST